MPEQQLTKQELATKIWEAANTLRSKIKAAEYKDYILGFMFYKFLSDKEEKFLADNDATKADIENASESLISMIKDGIGYYIAKDDLFSSWVEDGVNLTTGIVSEAIGRFDKNIKDDYRKVYEKIFATLAYGLGKLGDTSGSRDKAVRDIIGLINEIPATNDDYDVMGYIYEFFIFKFATAAKDDGAFYTPHEVSELIARILAQDLKGREGQIQVYDPPCGSAGLLLTIGQAAKDVGIDPDKIMYYGQEKITETYNYSRMNLIMKGIKSPQICIRNGDTLEDDWPYFDESTGYQPVFVDACCANPPYSLRWDPTNKENDVRFRGYGVAPKTKADYAFLLHCLYHLKPDGVMGIVLPHGVLFRGGAEETIRKALIDNHNIETIIGLPANLFYSTGIPTLVAILRKNRDSSDILFIDASKEFQAGKKQNVLTESNIQKIFDTVMVRKDVDKFAHLATIDEIRENGYNLNIPRYVDTFEKEELIDIDAVLSSINKYQSEKDEAWAKLREMIAQLTEY